MATTLSTMALRRYHGGPDPVAIRAAQVLGMRATSVHALMFGRGRVNLRCAQIIVAFKQCREEHRLVRWMSPIEAALRGILAPADTPALAVQAQTADGDEDVAEVAYLLNACEVTARALIRAIDTERTLQLERRQALAAQWGLA